MSQGWRSDTRSPDLSVDTTELLGGVQFLAKLRELSLLHSIQNRSEAHPANMYRKLLHWI
jgi:hypothetical protein